MDIQTLIMNENNNFINSIKTIQLNSYEVALQINQQYQQILKEQLKRIEQAQQRNNELQVLFLINIFFIKKFLFRKKFALL